jgi:hypothetical protein
LRSRCRAPRWALRSRTPARRPLRVRSPRRTRPYLFGSQSLSTGAS